MTFDELAALRAKSDPLAKCLEQQLRDYLEVLRPLLFPRRLLGQYVRSPGKEDVPGSEQALKDLKKRYGELCGRPFGLSSEWDDAVLQGLDGRLELHPWVYTHQIQTGGETRSVRITTPGQWVVTYHCGYSLSDLRDALAQRGERRVDDVRQFVINALVLNALLARSAGLTHLLSDLRFTVSTTTAPDLGALPLTTVTSCIPSIRPPDDVLLTAVRFSGVAAFLELLQVGEVAIMADPLKKRLLLATEGDDS